MTIGGVAAPLFYVSPTQINAVLAPGTPLGSRTLVVRSARGTASATIVVAQVSRPGLFSLYGSGARDGAILNAITYLTGAFSTRTANRPTYLSLFLTGLNPGVTPTVTIGGVAVPVTYAGPAPCCMGLDQINVQLPGTLAGAGRVPVVVRSAGFVSNVVEVVILPRETLGTERENETRNREISALAHIPGTSTALLADENDDVLRVIDIPSRAVTRVISLPDDAEPVAVAVRQDGRLALVAERRKGWAALVDLTTFRVVRQVPVGVGPSAVAIAGNLGLVSNTDDNSLSVIDLQTHAVVKTLPVGLHPRGIAIHPEANQALVLNRLSGTVSVIDLGSLTVVRTISLGANSRPEAIQMIGGTSLAAITDLGGVNGDVLILNVSTSALSPLNIAPARAGGLGALAMHQDRLYIAHQTDGVLLAVTVSTVTGAAAGPAAVIRVPAGVRTLAVDPADQILLAGSQSSGRIVLVSLSTEQVVGEINGLKRSDDEEDDDDERTDRSRIANAPVITSLTPSSSTPHAAFTLRIAGRNLAGATDVWFLDPDSIPGKGLGRGRGNSGSHSGGPFGARDAAFSVSDVRVTPSGEVTVVVSVTGAKPGPRVVRLATPNGDSSFVATEANTFTVRPPS